MSREVHWDGWWEGEIEITCDFCHKKHLLFPFHNENEAKDYARETRAKKKEGWVTTKVNGHTVEFHDYACRDAYIRKFTS